MYTTLSTLTASTATATNTNTASDTTPELHRKSKNTGLEETEIWLARDHI